MAPPIQKLNLLSKRFYILLLAVVFAGLHQEVRSQVNPLYEMEVLDQENLEQNGDGDGLEVLGANRILERADESPARTFVISREDIRRNGYTSLVDILKTLPGFRTSQPGSAMLGETFLMRGLMGNMYTKILIDGVPLLPSAAPGMPLAAQLPLQSAERIEIVLGPAAAAYGTDAMAGVINIITSSVDRPIESYGGVALGTSGRDLLHVNLGGKSGKGKNIVDFSFFANSSKMSDWRLMWEDTAAFYVDTVALSGNPIFAGDGQVPRVPEMAHESRLLGAKVAFRGLTYSYHNLFRLDHQALGSHPQDIAYHLDFTTYKESIQLHHLGYQKVLGNFSLTTNFSGLLYEINPRTSYRAILHPLANGTTLMYSQSTDLQLEQLVNYRFNSKWEILFGGVLQKQKGTPFQGYLDFPFSDETVETLEGVQQVANQVTPVSVLEEYSVVDKYDLWNYGAFGQAYFHTNRIRVFAGGRLDKAGRSGVRFSPKVSSFFRLTNSLSLRGMYAEAFRLPGEFYRSNNYRGVEVDGGMPGEFELSRYQAMLSPETLQNFEIGLDYKFFDHFNFSLHHYRHSRRGSIFNRIRVPSASDPMMVEPRFYSVSYYNNRSQSNLNSTQAMLEYKNKGLSVQAAVEYNVGQEKSDSLLNVDFYRSVPTWGGTFRLEAELPFKFHLGVFAKVFGEYHWTLQEVNGELYQNQADGYYNIDLTMSKDLSKRLAFFARVTNLTRTQTHGLLSNDLSGYQFPYIPQPGRHVLAGLTFDLNREEDLQ